MSEKVISEILGGIKYGQTRQQPSSQQQQPQGAVYGSFYQPGTQAVGFQLSPNAPHMYAWQQEIVNQLNRQDLFIATRSPGGGKTLPVFVYWADEILGLNTRMLFSNMGNQQAIQQLAIKGLDLFLIPETFPKILWCTPFRALNDQTIKQEFENSFLQLFMQIVNITQKQAYDNFLRTHRNVAPSFPPLNEALNEMMIEISNGDPHVVSTIGQIRSKMSEFTSVSDPAARSIIVQQIESLYKQLFELYERIIREYIRERIIGNEYENDHTGIDPKTGEPKPVVVAIYESATNIIKKYKPGTLRLIVFDEIQRVHLSELGDKTQDERAKQIAQAIHVILKSKAANRATGPNPARLVLLSGTENELAANTLTFIFNVAYNRNFPEKVEILDVGNVANITVRPMDKLRDENYVIQLIKEIIARKEAGSAFLFFNKQKIRDIVSKCISGVNPDLFTQQKTGMGTLSKKYYEPSDLRTISGHADASKIVNPLLRRAVSSGLGFTYSLKPDDVGYYPEIQHDNQIVQELFRTGKIYVLLATDNVEAGMNINIKTLYIPRFEKRREQIPIASRAQILNRVGRQPMECTIYTPSEFVCDVQDALQAVSSDYPALEPVMSRGMKTRYYHYLADKIMKDPIMYLYRIIKRILF